MVAAGAVKPSQSLYSSNVVMTLKKDGSIKLGDNCIQNFHLGRCIVGYTVGNLVLR